MGDNGIAAVRSIVAMPPSSCGFVPLLVLAVTGMFCSPPIVAMSLCGVCTETG